MVENTVKQTAKPKKSLFGIMQNIPLMVILGAIVALGISARWQFSNSRDFFNTRSLAPGTSIEGEDILSLMQGQTPKSNIPNKRFSTSDGYLALEYPPSYENSQALASGTSGADLSSNDLLLAYKVTIPEMMPSTLIVSGYNASSTEEVVGQVKQSFIKQQCQIDIQKSDNQNEPSYELFDSNYKCGDQGDMSAWRARFAVVPAGNIFYVVAAATLEKNWANAQLEIGTILNSISITKPTGSEDLKNTNDAGGDNNQNDETIQ